MLSTVLTVLLILTVIVLLVLITVFQHGNEGGIGSAFGSGNSAGFFGASGGANIIVRATWVCGTLFFVLATGLAWVRTHDSFAVSREIDSAIDSPLFDEIDDAGDTPEVIDPAHEAEKNEANPSGAETAPAETPETETTPKN